MFVLINTAFVIIKI